MKSSIKHLLLVLKRASQRRPNRVITRAMGQQRYFRAYDHGDDTFVFERGVWTGLDEHASVLIAEKADLRRGAAGHILTVTNGNHSVAALPLLGGLFWDLSRVPKEQRSDTMRFKILCGNVVDGKLEISQREVPCAKLTALDAWLTDEQRATALKFPLRDVVLVERNDETLEHYRKLGQEWRVKPLAWSPREVNVALAASRKRISTKLRYYHAVKGTHFLTYPDFHEFALRAQTDWEEFCAELFELVGVFEGNDTSFMRQEKFHGHHEIELFGLSRGTAVERLVPLLEGLNVQVSQGRIAMDLARQRILEIDEIYLSLLTRPEMANASSRDFADTLYMYLTGEIYSVMGEGATPAFDDRRTALPGATFELGRPKFHPGCDGRNEVLLANLRVLVSKDEHIEYANVYELRNDIDDFDKACPLGKGSTREVIYKTDRGPLVHSLVEKRMSHPGQAYGSYVMSRVEAFKALGIALPDYRLLRRRAKNGRTRSHLDYFFRTRCEGEPLYDLPATYFQNSRDVGNVQNGEDAQVVAQLAFLMGDAAAQNLVMKKYNPTTKNSLYDCGKEIYRFDYDIKSAHVMPLSVSYCSVRGSCGWPDLSLSAKNLERVMYFYMGEYAKALHRFAQKHPVVPEYELSDHFLEGFEYRMRALYWQFTVRRDIFEAFDPHLPGRYHFLPKWRFILWSLERQVMMMAEFRAAFLAISCELEHV